MNANKDRIILFGGGGHAKVLIDLILLGNEYEIMGILDYQLKPGTRVLDMPVLGDDSRISELSVGNSVNACIGIGGVKDTLKRKALFEKIRGLGVLIPALIHPAATVSGSASIFGGVQVMAGAIIQPDSVIQENTIINTGAIIDHDCSIGSHIHVCPGAVISGGCSIGDGAFIGTGASIINGINIGKNALVAAGSIVINDVPDNAEVMGAPAK